MFTVEVDEEFLDYVTDGSLAIEIYGNRSRGYDTKPSPLQLPQEDGNKSLVDRLVKQVIPYSHLVFLFQFFLVPDKILITNRIRKKYFKENLKKSFFVLSIVYYAFPENDCPPPPAVTKFEVIKFFKGYL